MRAIIPVAGVGSRLRPHTFTVPKVLLNVAGKPIIGHIMDKIIAEGFDAATIIIGYLGDTIKDYINANYSIQVDYVEQEERLGLGHAIYLSRHTISKDPILIILGDTIFDVKLGEMIDSPHSRIGVKEVADPRRFGVAEVRDGFIHTLIEKPEEPTSNLALVGLYYIQHPDVLLGCLNEMIKNNIRTKNEYQLTDGLQMMIRRGEKLQPYVIDGWYDCGKPETLLETNRHLLEADGTNRVPEGVVTIPPVYISAKATVTHSVIGPYTTIADGAVVDYSIIRNSIINEGATVISARLNDSIIGTHASVKGGFKRVNIGDSSELEYD
jgi:glucose-1-phosphate thymidylyltransferase